MREVPIHRAGTRPILLLGGDRSLVIFTATLSAILIIAMAEWLPAIFGVCLWFSATWALRQMAKSDPLLRRVYLRHLRYQSYYPHRSTPFCQPSLPRKDT